MIEADESDRSFLKLARDVAVITNVELDHHATYASLGELEEAMAEFAEPAELRVVGPGVELAGEVVRVGIDDGDLRAERLELLPGRSRFEVEGTTVELPVPGRHNVLNALAALAACRAAGVDLPDAAAALADFSGAGRRFERHGDTARGALVYDDYAHHPTEVRATLEAARTLGAGPPAGRVLPAAPLLAHAAARARLRARPRARRRGRGRRRLPGARARGGLPRRERPAGRAGRGGRGRRPAGLVAARARPGRSGCWPPSSARATCW